MGKSSYNILRIILLCTCIDLYYVSASGQNLDSLSSLLELPAPIDSAGISEYNFAAFSVHTSHPDLCDKLALKALEGAEQTNNLRGKALAKTCLGLSEWIRGNLSQSMAHMFEAMEAHEVLNNPPGIAAVTGNLGMIYDELEEYDKAVEYYTKSIDILKSIGKEDKIANSLSNLGSTFRKQNLPDSALKVYLKALELRIAADDKQGISSCYNNIAVVYYRHKGKTQEAINYYNKAIEIKKTLGDRYGMSNTYYNLGNLYKETEVHSQAKKYLSLALRYADSVQTKGLQSKILFALHDLAVQNGDMATAYNHQKRYYETEMAMAAEKKGDELRQLELKHDLATKEHMLDIVNRELEISRSQELIEIQRRNILLTALVSIAVLAFALFKWQRSKAKAKTALAELELENAKLREQELKTELEFKNRELTSYTINFLRKNQLMEDLQSISENLSKPAASETKDNIRKLDRIIRQSHNIDKDWRDFKAYFEGVHPMFFRQLSMHHPDLTNTEIKLCALIRLNMNGKEISEVLNISPESVKTARYRLRKKLKIEDSSENLNNFISRIGESVLN